LKNVFGTGVTRGLGHFGEFERVQSNTYSKPTWPTKSCGSGEAAAIRSVNSSLM